MLSTSSLRINNVILDENYQPFLNDQVYILDPSIGSINFKIAKRGDKWELTEGPEYVKDSIDYIGQHIDKRTRQL